MNIFNYFGYLLESLLCSALFWSLLAAIITVSIIRKMVNGNSRNNYGSGQKVFGCMMIVVFGGIFLLLTSTSQINLLYGEKPIENSAEDHIHDEKLQFGVTGPSPSYFKFFYGIMMDAGSTGTRIHVFKFKHIAADAQTELFDALFLERKPGLSSYADNPNEGAKVVNELLDEAKNYIPTSEWSKTPLALKATAGLRLLSPVKAEGLLEAVRGVFKTCPFKAFNDSVEIMEGTKEGVFIWITANYMMGTLHNPSQSVAVFDLGGGSTQVTFLPAINETLHKAPESDLVHVDVMKQKKVLYTHSYLGLGLMVSRFKIIGGLDEHLDDNGPPQTYDSECFLDGYSGTLNYQNKDFLIRGTGASLSSLSSQCYLAAKNYVESKISFNIPELSSTQILAVSYYYDRALDVNLIDSPEPLHNIKVSDFSEAAKNICESAEKTDAFLCLDLSFISALLQEGLKLPADTPLRIQKKINGREISWALGAMFQYIN